MTTLESAGIPWRIAFETPDWQSIRTATEQGLGISLLDSFDGMKDVRALTPEDNLPKVEPVYLTLRTRPGCEDDACVQALATKFIRLIEA